MTLDSQTRLLNTLRESKAKRPTKKTEPRKDTTPTVVLIEDRSAQAKLLKDIKTQKKFVPPPLKNQGDRICWVLNELAVHYPKVPVPFTYLTMILNNLTSIPRGDSQKVVETRRAVSPQRLKMRTKYNRDIISLKREAAVRATTSNEDFLPIAHQQNMKIAKAIQTKQQIDALFNVDALKRTDANAEMIDYHKRFTLVTDRMAKQLPAVASTSSSAVVKK
jgi:hypothetical protein